MLNYVSGCIFGIGLWVAIQRIWVIAIYPQEEALQKAVFADGKIEKTSIMAPNVRLTLTLSLSIFLGVVVGLVVTIILSELVILSISKVEESQRKNEKRK